MVVVVDAAPAILLQQAGLWHTACRAYAFTIPSEVYQELTGNNHPNAGLFADDAASGVFKVHPPMPPSPDIPTSLGPGEAAVFSLFLKGHGNFILTDDGKAAIYAMKTGIPFINALLVPRLLGAVGWIKTDDVAGYETTLMAAGRYSQKIKHKAQTLTPDHLRMFWPKKHPE